VWFGISCGVSMLDASRTHRNARCCD
jgi:hypothetical protein